MYHLYEVGSDLYQLHSKFSSEGAVEGTLTAVLSHAVVNLRFDLEELETALLDMNENGLDGAEFGINRSFLYSFDRKSRVA